MKIIRVGKDGRISLAGSGGKPNQWYSVSVDMYNNIVLTPVELEQIEEVDTDERNLYSN